MHPRTSLRATLGVGAAAAAIPVAAGLPFLARYGWHRDELYFVAASHHLAFGYVDFPPVVALLARAVLAVFGTSLDALRLTTAVIGATSVVFVGLCAREVGGGLRAQAGAAVAWATAPLILGAASIFHPTWVDVAAQTATLYLVLLAATRPAPRAWLAVGVVAGLGLEAKYTIAMLLAALIVGFASTGRREIFRMHGPWLAAGIVVLLLLPNLGWQVAHGWPSAQFAGSQHVKTADDTPPLTYLVQAGAFLAAGSVLAVIGAIWMWRRSGLRPFAVATGVVFAAWAVEQGRSYYPLPAVALAVAAGAVALDGWRPARRRRRRMAVAALVLIQLALLVAASPLVVPIRTTAGMIQSGSGRTRSTRTRSAGRSSRPRLRGPGTRSHPPSDGMPRSSPGTTARPARSRTTGLGSACRRRSPATSRGSTGARTRCRSGSSSRSASTRSRCGVSARRSIASQRSRTASASTTRSAAARSTSATWPGRWARSGRAGSRPTSCS